MVKTLYLSIILETQIPLWGLRVQKSFPSLPEKRAPRNGFAKRGNGWGRRWGDLGWVKIDGGCIFGHRECKEVRLQRGWGAQQGKVPKTNFSVAGPAIGDPLEQPEVTGRLAFSALAGTPSCVIPPNRPRASLGPTRGKGFTVIVAQFPQAGLPGLGGRRQRRLSKQNTPLFWGSQETLYTICVGSQVSQAPGSHLGKGVLHHCPPHASAWASQPEACHQGGEAGRGSPGVWRIGLDYNKNRSSLL